MHDAGAIGHRVRCVDEFGLLRCELAGVEQKEERDQSTRQREQTKYQGLSPLTKARTKSGT
jgi:hypothetical protein